MSSVVVTRIIRACKEPVKRSCGTFDAFLTIAFRTLIVGTLFLLLFSLTLGVGVLILCDRRLRLIFRSLVTNRTAEPDRFRMNRSNGLWKRESTTTGTESIHSSHSTGFVERIIDRRTRCFAADSFQKALENLAWTHFVEIRTTFAQHQID